MSYRITRTHEIDAGHRVCGHLGKCAHLHGHRYTFALTCEAVELDPLGMVIDFAVIKDRLCGWLDEQWDHRMLIWVHDPMFEVLRDLDEHVTALSRNPTAENLARIMVDDIGPMQLVGTGVRLVRCVVHETSKCSAEYTSPDTTPVGYVPRMAMGWTE
jgi:6-pyruvoyltetrahydropterin/6-carboxytetrahydropterin synthase